jgi:site-specific DNA recombinase
MSGRDGARALAAWLNEGGHRTKAGRPWRHTAVLTVLRNPVYVGKVFFRDALHDGPHPHWSTRSSSTAPGPPLRAWRGLLETRFGHLAVPPGGPRRLCPLRQALRRHLGCRQPLRTATTRALPVSATAPSTAMPSACRHKSRTWPSSTRSSTSTSAPTSSTRPSQQPGAGHAPGEATTPRSWPSSGGVTKAEDAIKSGTLSKTQRGKRLEGLAAKVRNLRQRREELVDAIQRASGSAPDAGVIAEMRHHIEKAVTDAAVPARKALLQALVHEIRVEGRDRVVPWFRVPARRGPEGSRPGAIGAPGRTRTCDTRFRKPLLYPLSYRGRGGAAPKGGIGDRSWRKG